MAEVLPRHYIFGILMFSLFVVGGSLLIAEFQREDGSYVNAEKYENFDRLFNKTDKINAITDQYKTNVTNSQPDQGTFGVLNSLISSSWGTLKLLTTSLSFMNDALYGLSSFFGVPRIFVTFFIGLITIMLIFAIFSAIFQRDI